MSPKGSPFNFFHFLQPAGVSQSPKGPPFSILSLRYGADFGRSRLVSICKSFNVENTFENSFDNSYGSKCVEIIMKNSEKISKKKF